MRYLGIFAILVGLRVLRTLLALAASVYFKGAWRVPLWCGFAINTLYWVSSIAVCFYMVTMD